MRLLLTIFTILTILSSEGSSQNIDWGLGLIKIDDVSSEGFYNIPETGLEVLDENKKQIGSLIVKDNRIILKTSSEEKILDAFNDFNHIGYGPAYLKYFSFDGKYASILKHSFDKPAFITIAGNLKEYEYLELIHQTLNKEWVLYTGNECVEVFDTTDSDGILQGCIKNTHTTQDYGVDIVYSGEIEGEWMFVKVKEFDFEDYMVMQEDGYIPPKVTKEYSGWVRIVFDHCEPSLWYHWDAY